MIQDLSATKNKRTRIFLSMEIYSNLVFDVQNKIDAYPSWDKSITEYTMQLQVIYGGHSAVLPLSSYRVPPLLQRPIGKV